MTRAELLAQVASLPNGKVPRSLREQQLLALAEELFAERGYRATSMDELARRAAVSKPVIYDLFGSKDELFRRAFKQAAEELAGDVAEAAVANMDDLESMLRASAVAFFEFIGAHRGAWAMLFADETSGHLSTHVDAIRSRQAEFTAGLLAGQAAESGAKTDPKQLAAAGHMLNGAYEMLARWWNENPEVGTETLADWLVEFAMPGLRLLTVVDR